MKTNKIESILKYSLIVVIFLTIAGIFVLIFNDHSAEDTFYDILFFVVGAMALIVGIGSSLDVRYQRRAMRSLHKEISEAVSELRSLDKESDKILHELEKDEKLDAEMIERLEERDELLAKKK